MRCRSLLRTTTSSSRAFDLTIPTLKDAGRAPDTQTKEVVASLVEGVRISSKEMREIWAPTNADPSKSWTVHGAPSLPAHVRVAEGPAKIVDGKVKLFVCTNGHDEDAVLDTHETIAELCETTKEDASLQKEIRGSGC